MTSAADLLALQDIDLKRDARRAIVADIESRLAETEELIEARETLADDEEILARLRRRQREFEQQLEDIDAKIRPLETRLYDGSVRNPKELTDMQHELESLKAKRSKLDDEALALLENIEEGERNVASSKANLAAVQAAWEQDQSSLLRDRDRAESETRMLDEERLRWTSNMEAHVVGLYERLRPAHQGKAVARIERGICQGCRVTLPTHLVQRVRAGTELIQCPRCERILVGA